MISGGLAFGKIVKEIGIKRIVIAIAVIVVFTVGWFLLQDMKNIYRENAELGSALGISISNEESLRENLKRLAEEVKNLEIKSRELHEDIVDSQKEIDDLEIAKEEELERIRALEAADSSCDAAFQLLVDEARKERGQ